jgi:hypothetical protein
MNDRRQLVVTIHGVNTDGDWQDSVEQILKFHFRCENYKYRTYRYCGALLIFLGPWGLLASAVCLAGYCGWQLDPTVAHDAWLAGLGSVLALLLVGGRHMPGCRKRMVALVDIAWPVVLLLLAASIGFFAARRLPRGAPVWPVVLGFLSVAFLVAAVAEAMWRRRREAHRFADWVHDRANGAPGTNFIAHSFGTYLTGTILLYNVNPSKNQVRINRARRVVLAGSVLPVNYSWAGLTYADPPAFHQVRNEAGGRDLVVWLAGIAQRLLPQIGIGDAGLRGFEGARGLVHTVDDEPMGYCQDCPTPIEKRLRRVHNVRHPTFFHGDAFLGRAQAQTFWLPFLWGLDPLQYWDFRQLCNAAASYYREVYRCQRRLKKKREAASGGKRNRDAVGHLTARRQEAWLGLESVERQLEERVWHWVESRRGIGETYGDFLAFQIAYCASPRSPSAEQVRDWTKKAIRRVWMNVVCAQREQWKPDANGAVVRWLYPDAAGTAAITKVLS